jgi:5-methyltetrahydropteroyltriglutamate--homocysteine methyltransferase
MVVLLASNHSSYPRVGDRPEEQRHRQAYARWERGELSDAEFERVQDEVTREVIWEQIRAGLDVVTDGQIRWYDPISHLARRVEGCEIDGLLRFFDTNFYFRQPVVLGSLSRRGPVLLREFEFARRASSKPVKAVVPGPYTLAKLSIDRVARGLDFLVREWCRVVREEIADLARGGARLIQVEEPAILQHPEEWGVLERAVEELAAARGGSDLLLALYFGDAARLYAKLCRLPVQALVLDLTYSPGLPNLIARFGCPLDLGLGIVDGRNTRMERVEDMLGVLRAVIPNVGSQRVYILPSCGVGDYLPRDVAFQKLRLLSELRREACRLLDGVRAPAD